MDVRHHAPQERRRRRPRLRSVLAIAAVTVIVGALAGCTTTRP
jgi:hypothetical protein